MVRIASGEAPLDARVHTAASGKVSKLTLFLCPTGRCRLGRHDFSHVDRGPIRQDAGAGHTTVVSVRAERNSRTGYLASWSVRYLSMIAIIAVHHDLAAADRVPGSRRKVAQSVGDGGQRRPY